MYKTNRRRNHLSLKHDNLSLLSWNVFLYKSFYVLNLDWEFRGGILFKVLGFKKLISFFCLGQEGIYLNNLPMRFSISSIQCINSPIQCSKGACYYYCTTKFTDINISYYHHCSILFETKDIHFKMLILYWYF